MGSGYWDTRAATTVMSARGFASTDAMSNASAQTVYRSHHLSSMLNPYNVVRECRDSDDHPHSLPVILGLDVTGSMGHAATTCAAKLDETMTELYKNNHDVEFCVMGIGDFIYDSAPLQVTQFESDIRILEQTLKLYFEGGGGGNNWESYTAAWYFGLHNCIFDCWDRGERGIIITIGDEALNPMLPGKRIKDVIGGQVDGDIDTKQLYAAASEKFDIYHIAITDQSSYKWNKNLIEDTWRPLLGDHLIIAESTDLPQLIAAIVNSSHRTMAESSVTTSNDGISW